MSENFKTHQCEGLNKFNDENYDDINIKYSNPYYGTNNVVLDRFGWWLCRSEFNFDYQIRDNVPLFIIKYCPYCGKKL